MCLLHFQDAQLGCPKQPHGEDIFAVGHKDVEGLLQLGVMLARGQSSPWDSLLCREHGKGCAVPWLCAGQLFSCTFWGRVAQAHQCSGHPRASTGKTCESPGLPGKVHMTGMHIA